LQPLQKRQFPFSIRGFQKLIPALLLAALLGTYLDLYFVGTGLYSFPKRPFSHIFTIDIAFTVVALPIFTLIFLIVSQKLKLLGKAMLIILLGLFMAAVEKQAEAFGFFVHQESWEHLYSFIGYLVYLTIIYVFYSWTKSWKQ